MLVENGSKSLTAECDGGPSVGHRQPRRQPRRHVWLEEGLRPGGAGGAHRAGDGGRNNRLPELRDRPQGGNYLHEGALNMYADY